MGLITIDQISSIPNLAGLYLFSMKFESNELYHVYNQGNNRQKIFFAEDDYNSFLNYVKILILPLAEIIAYCLMPNHFHFLLSAKENCATMVQQGGILMNPLSNGFRKLLSGYCRVFNKRYSRSGSLFRQKTKAKCLTDELEVADTFYTSKDYCYNCFRYIHQNPVVAALVTRVSEWKWSSARFYSGKETESFCNLELARKFCGYDRNDFLKNERMDEHWIKIIEEDS